VAASWGAAHEAEQLELEQSDAGLVRLLDAGA